VSILTQQKEKGYVITMVRANCPRRSYLCSDTEQEMILVFVIPMILGGVSMYYILRLCFQLGEKTDEINNIGNHPD